MWVLSPVLFVACAFVLTLFLLGRSKGVASVPTLSFYINAVISNGNVVISNLVWWRCR